MLEKVDTKIVVSVLVAGVIGSLIVIGAKMLPASIPGASLVKDAASLVK